MCWLCYLYVPNPPLILSRYATSLKNHISMFFLISRSTTLIFALKNLHRHDFSCHSICHPLQNEPSTHYNRGGGGEKMSTKKNTG